MDGSGLARKIFTSLSVNGIAVQPESLSEVAALLDRLVATGEHLAAMVIRAARLAAILLRIARGLRRAYKGPAYL